MELSLRQQALEQLTTAKNILIALPKVSRVDNWSAAAALQYALTKLGKEVQVISESSGPGQLSFLPESFTVLSLLSGSQTLVLELSTQKSELAELSYQEQPGKVSVFLTAKTGSFSPADVQVVPQKKSFDLIITLAAANLESLGKIYQDNAELFSQSPKLNLDTKSTNEYFGATNVVDVTETSVCELLYDLFTGWEEVAMDETLATCLLAGIISETQSFQISSTTPKALLVASELITRGAHQQEIIQRLYKTKDYNLLKLWGRALARIETEPELSLLVATLHASDFAKTETGKEQLLLVLKELLENVSGFQTIALIAETQVGNISLLAAALPHISLQSVADTFSANYEPMPILGPYKYISLEATNLSPEACLASLKQALAAGSHTVT